MATNRQRLRDGDRMVEAVFADLEIDTLFKQYRYSDQWVEKISDGHARSRHTDRVQQWAADDRIYVMPSTT